MSAPKCAGCLGSRECWVCLGSGAVDTERSLGVCQSCQGTRRCQYCLAVAAPVRRAADVVIAPPPTGRGEA